MDPLLITFIILAVAVVLYLKKFERLHQEKVTKLDSRLQDISMAIQHKNVVLFGEAGSGKSSIVNMLMGNEVANVSDDAVGCTFDFKCYQTDFYEFYDTVGLSEGLCGTVPPNQAVGSLVKLLKSLKNGVNLLIFVMEKGRIKKTLEENYKLFVNQICLEKVPVIAVVTHCEQEKEMGQWWEANKKHFDKYGMKFETTISGCATTGEGLLSEFGRTMKIRYEETKVKLYKSLKSHALHKAWKMGNWLQWFMVIAKQVFNHIAVFLNWGTILAYLPRLQEALIDIGYQTNEAAKLANEIYDTLVNSNLDT